MKLDEVIRSAYEASGQLEDLNDGTVRCNSCGRIGPGIMDIPHSSDCALKQAVEAVVGNNGKTVFNFGVDELSTDMRIELMQSLPSSRIAEINKMVDDFRYAEDSTERLAMASNIRKEIPTVDMEVLTGYLVNGISNSSQADMFRMYLIFEDGARKTENDLLEKMTVIQQKLKAFDGVLAKLQGKVSGMHGEGK